VTRRLRSLRPRPRHNSLTCRPRRMGRASLSAVQLLGLVCQVCASRSTRTSLTPVPDPKKIAKRFGTMARWCSEGAMTRPNPIVGHTSGRSLIRQNAVAEAALSSTWPTHGYRAPCRLEQSIRDSPVTMTRMRFTVVSNIRTIRRRPNEQQKLRAMSSPRGCHRHSPRRR